MCFRCVYAIKSSETFSQSKHQRKIHNRRMLCTEYILHTASLSEFLLCISSAHNADMQYNFSIVFCCPSCSLKSIYWIWMHAVAARTQSSYKNHVYKMWTTCGHTFMQSAFVLLFMCTQSIALHRIAPCARQTPFNVDSMRKRCEVFLLFVQPLNKQSVYAFARPRSLARSWCSWCTYAFRKYPKWKSAKTT